MPKAVIVLTVVLLTLAASAAAASTQTLLTLNSQPGDYIGGGNVQAYTPADGTLLVLPTSGGGVQVNFQSPASYWSLFFVPRAGQKLSKQEYEGAQRYPFQGPLNPGLDVYGNGRGCNTISGRFLVSEVVFAVDGSITRLAIDFEQHCEGFPPALFGSLRFNSSVTVVPRVSVADATALKGNAGTSDATVVLSLSLPITSPVSVRYSTNERTAVEDRDYRYASGKVQFQPGETSKVITVPIIGNRQARGNRSFQVQLSSANGAPLGDKLADVIIIDPNVPLTALAFASQPGDYIGQGQLYLFTIADGIFTTSRNYDNGISVRLSAADFWWLDFAAPANAMLIPGSYESAQRFPFQASGNPGLNISGAGRGCNTLAGRFAISDVAYAANGDVQRFAADFEQHCEGLGPALFGSIRINASLRQLSVTNARIQNTNGRSAVFTVTLNPPSPDLVTVSFATADGTGLDGIDYVGTWQTITFLPGETQHTVAVPLLSPSTANKQFFGQLSSPSGSAVWISRGRAAF